VPGFTKVSEIETDENRVVDHPAVQRDPAMAAQIMSIALKALAQKALVAISSLFTAATVASAWWLWLQAPPDPSVKQLVGLALYGLFILSLHVIRRGQ